MGDGQAYTCGIEISHWTRTIKGYSPWWALGRTAWELQPSTAGSFY